MDITLLQIQNGSYFDLMFFKKEIISYLSDKKFSTKSITLVKTLKMIDREICRRKNGKICKQTECSFEVSANSLKGSIKAGSCNIPDFLNEDTKKVELLSNKRGLEKYVLEHPHLMSRVATYLCSKDEKTPDTTNRFNSCCKKEFDITFKGNFSEEEVESCYGQEDKSTGTEETSEKDKEEDQYYPKSIDLPLNDTDFLCKEKRFIDADYDKLSNKNSYTQGTRSTDENSNFNQFLLEEDDFLIKNSTFDRSKLRQEFLPERLDDIHVDLFFN